ncbi:Respiratory supercomplex factor 1, partial [Colletotrichum shisoi]
MFRARVAAQGFTVFAMVAGSMYYNKDRERTAELRKIKEANEAEEKRQRWIRELEARDDEEKALKAMLQKKRAKMEAQNSGAAEDEVPAEGDKAKSGGVLGALGLSARTKPEEGDAVSEATSAEKPQKKEKPNSTLGTIGEIYGRKPSSSDGSSSEEPKK